MILSALMSKHNPNPDYEGWVTNDDWVLAIDTSEEKKAEPANYAVVETGISGLDSNLNPITQDKNYIRAGQSTMKTGNQRSFTVGGDRYVGDDFQDFALSHKIKYGTGSTVVVPYVYFCLLTGQGERGDLAIIVNSDGSGDAGNSSELDIELKKSGANPEEYTYSAATTN
ncbi:MAG: hypothetical protein LUE11_06775 [Clostridia bacterium]|nr:hypothetical protein [Clostridia bacterium]